MLRYQWDANRSTGVTEDPRQGFLGEPKSHSGCEIWWLNMGAMLAVTDESTQVMAVFTDEASG